jgi:hypothetical protein
VEPDLVRADPSLLDKDLAKTKEILVQYAGAIQMLFYHQSAEGATSGDQLGQITLPQFRGVMTAAKVRVRFEACHPDIPSCNSMVADQPAGFVLAGHHTQVPT